MLVFRPSRRKQCGRLCPVARILDKAQSDSEDAQCVICSCPTPLPLLKSHGFSSWGTIRRSANPNTGMETTSKGLVTRVAEAVAEMTELRPASPTPAQSRARVLKSNTRLPVRGMVAPIQQLATSQTAASGPVATAAPERQASNARSLQVRTRNWTQKSNTIFKLKTPKCGGRWINS